MVTRVTNADQRPANRCDLHLYGSRLARGVHLRLTATAAFAWAFRGVGLVCARPDRVPARTHRPTDSTVAVIVLRSPIREIPANGLGKPFVATTGFLLGPHEGPVINEPPIHGTGSVDPPHRRVLTDMC